jgi:hypothetical protein
MREVHFDNGPANSLLFSGTDRLTGSWYYTRAVWVVLWDQVKWRFFSPDLLKRCRISLPFFQDCYSFLGNRYEYIRALFMSVNVCFSEDKVPASSNRSTRKKTQFCQHIHSGSNRGKYMYFCCYFFVIVVTLSFCPLTVLQYFFIRCLNIPLKFCLKSTKFAIIHVNSNAASVIRRHSLSSSRESRSCRS